MNKYLEVLFSAPLYFYFYFILFYFILERHQYENQLLLRGNKIIDFIFILNNYSVYFLGNHIYILSTIKNMHSCDIQINDEYINEPRLRLNESDLDDKMITKGLKEMKDTAYDNLMHFHFR